MKKPIGLELTKEDRALILDELNKFEYINAQAQMLLSIVLADYIENLPNDCMTYELPLEGIMTILKAQSHSIYGFSRFIETNDIFKWKTID
ncbi:hypothetical protein BKH46_07365 [Helicobacter sp. 12S02634-8]|uniref:hypothetical protein n=1 Tax=Helicobacter sp. 12S02634-8 TaxID=1476199 RepID=UPI000BA605A9|nr:hypothetical protein [Helicobacter sp. 12S02634-8]PAF46553.1 hypothetical protein BKH46_07365 [Helicobacter sp. 12S02634-8]